MPTVTNTVLKPDGTLAAGVRVRIRLVASDPIGAPGFVGASDRTIVSEAYVLTTSAGVWTAVLEANANIVPASTVYEVMENVGSGVAAYYVTVPNGAGPYWAGDILASAPALGPALPSPYSPSSAMLASAAAPISVPNGTQTSLGALTANVYDPAGYRQSGSYVSTIEPGTYGPNAWFRLPVGVWNVQTTVQWTNLTGTYRAAGPGVIDDRGLLAGVDAFLYEPNYYEYFGSPVTLTPAAIPPAGRLQITNLTVVVTPAMVAASDAKSPAGSGWAMLNGFVQHDSGAPQNVTIAQIAVMQIGAFPR